MVIIFTLSRKCHKHITSIVAKGNTLVGRILQMLRTHSKEVMLTLLKTLIVPQVEYGYVIWMPISQNLVNLIVSIQRRFTKMIDCFKICGGNLLMPIKNTCSLKHIHLTKVKGTVCCHTQLQSYTTCTKPKTRNQKQSHNKNKSNTKVEHQQCINKMGKILQKWKFLHTQPTIIQQYPS